MPAQLAQEELERVGARLVGAPVGGPRPLLLRLRSFDEFDPAPLQFAHQRLRLCRVTGPLDAHGVLRPRLLVGIRRRLDAVGAAELLPDRVEQPRLQHHGHRPQRQDVRIVVL